MKHDLKPGARLKSERLKLGLSQTAVAQAAGISKTTQAGYEAGQHLPDIEYMGVIADLGFDRFFIETGKSALETTIENNDWELLAEIVDYMEEWSQSRQIAIPKHKRAHLLKLIYQQCLSTGKEDSQEIEKTLSLIA